MTTPTDTPTRIPATKTAAVRINRYLNLKKRIGKLCEKQERALALLEKSMPRNTPVEMPDGDLWQLQKPDGKFVRFSELELKKVPRNPRSPKPVAAGVSPAESEAAP